MLEVRNLAVSYGRHRALEGVSVRVDKGEICVILGANGAGKSTLLKTIAGMVKPDAGAEIVMNGKPIAGMKPHRIVEEGIALVPEGRGIFGELSVAENLQLGAFASRARKSERETLELIYRLFPKLAERKRQVARTMSGGEQQMVAIGRALMSKPDILMLDEPSLGLSPILTKDLFRSLKQVAAAGVGILLVEQNAKQSLAIADRGYLVENGLVTGEGRASDLASDPAVVNAYLGGTAKQGVRTAPGSKTSIRLPSSIPLPVDFGAMRDALSDLAGRANRIQSAFVRSMRRGANVPSAFVGRYDPKAAGDPWEDAAPARESPGIAPPAMSRDAHALAQTSAAFARRAAERMAGHVRTVRLSSPAPSAFAAPFAPREEAEEKIEPVRPPFIEIQKHGKPAPVAAGSDPAALASHASDRLAAHVAATRKAAPLPSAFASMRPTAAEEDRTASTAAAGGEPHRGVTASQAREQLDDPRELARRASERFAGYLAARRKSAPIPSAFSAVTASRVRPLPPVRRKVAARREDEPRPLPNGDHARIGHNSAGFDVEEEQNPATTAARNGPDVAGLVARAAAIHAAHVEARRRKLTAFVIPAEKPAGEDLAEAIGTLASAGSAGPAAKSAKKHKHRKSADDRKRKKRKET